MHHRKGGGISGSLRKHVAWLVRNHQKSNMKLLEYGYSTGERLLRNLLGKGSLSRFLIEYVVLIFLLIIVDLFVEQYWPGYLPGVKDNSETLASLGSLFGAQATMIGLIFPIAIGLVTLLVQREGSGSTNADIQVYYNESLAYQVGCSSFCLVIILALQIFFRDYFDWYFCPYMAPRFIFKSFLPILYLLWFILNFIALWYFLKVSLDFVRPSKRASLRKKFAANNVISKEIFRMVMEDFYHNPSNWLPDYKGEETHSGIIIGANTSFDSIPEVYDYFSYPKTLTDVRMKFLRWIVRRWIARNKNVKDNRLRDPVIIFPLTIGSEVKGNTILCYTIGDVRLNRFDKFLIRISFSFKRKRK